jgi:hypothetical protein
MSGMGFAHGAIGRIIRMESNTGFRIVSIRKRGRFTGSAKGYKRRLKTRDYLRSSDVAYSVEFRRLYIRSGSRRRILVGKRR